jgi:hypothetical protein
MTYTRPNRVANKRPKDDRDWLLMVILAFLNLVSGYTTVTGAAQILPSWGWAWILGLSVQGILFLSLAELMLRHAPRIKWLTVLILSFFSIYTSFVTYYGSLTQNLNKELAKDQAIQAHNQLVSQVYSPMQQQLIELEASANKAIEAAGCEQQGCTTGLFGKGPEYLRLQAKAREAKGKYEEFKTKTNVVEEKLNYDLEDSSLTPKEILRRDGEALALVPPEFKNNFEIKRENYIDTEKDIDLLTPYNKVRRWETSAIGPLFLALSVDGLAVLLGTVITIKQEKKSFFVVFGEAISNIINDIRIGFAYILGAVEAPVKNKLIYTHHKQLSLRLQGKGSDFLLKFNQAISLQHPNHIDYQVLQKTLNSSAFDELFYQLSHPNVAFLEFDQGQWKTSENCYYELKDWLRDEIERLHDEEEKKNYAPDYDDLSWGFSPFDDSDTATNLVKLYIPLILPKKKKI